MNPSTRKRAARLVRLRRRLLVDVRREERRASPELPAVAPPPPGR